MPVDPLEAARERLERRLCGVTAPVVYVNTELLRTILAELDRRSPPTGELPPVYVGPYAPGSKEWWLVRQVANGDERRSWYELTDADRKALAAAPPPPDAPTRMVLHCPKCGLQHIDEAVSEQDGEGREIGWSNPPHRSHLCHGCGHIWRPADVPTEGVAAIQSRGKADSPIAVSRGLDREDVARELREIAFEVSSMVCAASDVHKVYPDPAKAVDRIDALLAALSAPAGGGMDSLRPSGAPQPALGGKPPLDEPESAAGAIPVDAVEFAGTLLDYDGEYDTGYRFLKAGDTPPRPDWLRGASETPLYRLIALAERGAPAQPQETHDLGASNTLQGAQGAPAGSAPADTGRGE